MSCNKLALLRVLVVLALIGALPGIAVLGEARIAPDHQDPAIPPSPPFASLLPDHLDFGNQVVARTSAPKRITVKNTGGKPLYFDSVTLGGDNPSAFAIQKDTCSGAAVEPERACMIDITFTPLKTGGRHARLKLNNNALDSPQRLKLTGNGINSSAVPPF
jgi:hypothetical protein